jgi:dihydrofolate reductase
MGRKTYQSIGKALPGRRNIVISRQNEAQSTDAEWVQSLEQA